MGREIYSGNYQELTGDSVLDVGVGFKGIASNTERKKKNRKMALRLLYTALINSSEGVFLEAPAHCMVLWHRLCLSVMRSHRCAGMYVCGGGWL